MSDNHPDELIQQYVDAVDSEPEWGVSGFVLMVGFERVDSDGTLLHEYKVYTRHNQPPWTTHGLIADSVEHLERTE
ncbi:MULTISPECIES: hypothetical protein [Mycobacteroides]|uniref:DUF7213 family protein n=1 Tax=Mycobacteroides TaxID=670516 RepID=UPI000712DF86|nr:MULTISPECIES: hypothetical protein [Mycobacteroides]OHU67385.1 hypothetical protein BKG87_22055 [Mycobacteroides chelonae]KRQ27183.1 hypothetical protein AOT87_04385 [Mycobacteroides sp. H003]KRQ32507.1 hypothetical protein AOT91_11475 [Mycobacteroides sp. H092]KRQ42147.1 hypothetical protein AOT88_25630 [Mycobacteroides sp. H063]KRQ43658.1 hypothetical protein AOT92_07860 [Mycobacteroides sp. H101]